MSDGEIDWGLRNLPGVALIFAQLMEVGELSLPESTASASLNSVSSATSSCETRLPRVQTHKMVGVAVSL